MSKGKIPAQDGGTALQPAEEALDSKAVFSREYRDSMKIVDPEFMQREAGRTKKYYVPISELSETEKEWRRKCTNERVRRWRMQKKAREPGLDSVLLDSVSDESKIPPLKPQSGYNKQRYIPVGKLSDSELKRRRERVMECVRVRRKGRKRRLAGEPSGSASASSKNLIVKLAPFFKQQSQATEQLHSAHQEGRKFQVNGTSPFNHDNYQEPQRQRSQRKEHEFPLSAQVAKLESLVRELRQENSKLKRENTNLRKRCMTLESMQNLAHTTAVPLFLENAHLWPSACTEHAILESTISAFSKMETPVLKENAAAVLSTNGLEVKAGEEDECRTRVGPDGEVYIYLKEEQDISEALATFRNPDSRQAEPQIT